jgi:choline dehydrogenase-like flavoprotein
VLELSKASLRAVLLEGGDVLANDYDQILNKGEITGDPFTGRIDGPVRGFGGATRQWFGQCIRFDPIDFEQRDWVPYSGWLMPPTELDAWYPGAERFFRIEGESYNDQLFRKLSKVSPSLLTHLTIYTTSINLGALCHRHIKEHPRIPLLLKANTLEVTRAVDGRSAPRSA